METERNKEWLNDMVPDKLIENDDLLKIVVFYVFSVAPTSYIHNELSDYGWENIKNLTKALLQSSSNKNLFYFGRNKKEFDDKLKESCLDNFPGELSEEKVCVYTGKESQAQNILRHIRNSMAHGRLNIYDVKEECFFAFEDVKPISKSEKLEITARMIIKKSTLLKWIDIIQAGEQEYLKNIESKKQSHRRKRK